MVVTRGLRLNSRGKYTIVPSNNICNKYKTVQFIHPCTRTETMVYFEGQRKMEIYGNIKCLWIDFVLDGLDLPK